MICKPIAFAMSAPTADGSAAAVVCSKEFMESNQMQVCCFTSTAHQLEISSLQNFVEVGIGAICFAGGGNGSLGEKGGRRKS